MSKPLKDGTHILIKYYNTGFSFRTKSFERYPDPIWIQAYWDGKSWVPYMGSEKLSTTQKIKDIDVVDWMKLPEN